jgi:hypothetical protein
MQLKSTYPSFVHSGLGDSVGFTFGQVYDSMRFPYIPNNYPWDYLRIRDDKGALLRHLEELKSRVFSNVVSCLLERVRC